MALAYTIGTIAAGSAVSIEVTPPTHNDGDLLVLVGTRNNNGNIFVNETDWAEDTELQRTVPDMTIGVFWKIASSEPSTLTFEAAASSVLRAVCYKFTGFDSGTPFDQTTTTDATQNNTDTPDPPAITTQTDGAIVVVANMSTNADTSAKTQPSGYTLDADHTGSSNTIACASKTVATAASEDPGTWSGWSAGGTADHNMVTFAIRPETTALAAAAYVNRVNQ
jgi:hypothetical protein